MYMCTPETIATLKITSISINHNLVPLCNPSYASPCLHPNPRQSLTFLSLWISLPFLEFYMDGVLRYVFFFVQLL